MCGAAASDVFVRVIALVTLATSLLASVCGTAASHARCLRRRRGVAAAAALQALLHESRSHRKDTQRSFYSSVAGLDCKDTLKQLESVVATEEEVDSYFCGGEFLPLAVWATRGFNTEAIQTKSLKADIKEDRVLGTV